MKRFAGILTILILSSLMTGCFLYEVRDYNNPYDPKLTDGATPIPYAAIQLDGDTSEWITINPLISDRTNEGTYSGQPTIPGGDLDQLKMAQDDENLYFYVSTANGIPLETPQVSLNLNFSDEYGYSMTPASLSHNTNEYMDSWNSYYNTPSIRFAGLNTSENAIEFGISKIDYWDTFNTNSKVRVDFNTWYEPYNLLYGNGNLDDQWDTDTEYNILLKAVNESQPSSDTPIVQFGRPSGSLFIDGDSGDLGIWSETGYWYQDFLNDDTATTDNNCDIDKIYIKQDDEYVYVLLTFNDPADYVTEATQRTYNITASRTDSMDYNLNCSFTAGVWAADLNGDLNSIASSAVDGYVEIRFDKSQDWDSMQYGSYSYQLQVFDSGSNLVDEVSFMGAYKSLTDPTPSP